MAVKLLSIWPSPFGMSCAVALKYKGVQFEVIEENLLNRSKLLLESNPVYKQVPVLIHDGKAICESLVILEYIEETWPAGDGRPDLLPRAPYERAVARFWAHYGNKMFLETGLKLMKKFGDEHEAARKQIIEQFLTLEEGMAKIGSEKPFFFGSQPSLPDIVLVSLVSWYLTFETLGDIKFPDASVCPRMHAWLDAMRDLPNVNSSVPDPLKLLEQEKKMRQIFRKMAEDSSSG